MARFEHAVFGNLNGSHQLLETSLVGKDSLLEELRFLVDRPVGHVGTEVMWSPYWGCGPLREWWVLWRGEEDHMAARRNMVRTRSVLVPLDAVGTLDDLHPVFERLSVEDIERIGTPPVGDVVRTLVRGGRPAIVPGIRLAPSLLWALWPQLWPSARRQLSLRTLFGSETLTSGPVPDIVVIPEELKPRWRTHRVLGGQESGRHGDEGIATFSGEAAPELERLLRANWQRLPGDLSVLERLDRIASRFKALHNGSGKVADALVIVRTIDAFQDGLELRSEDQEALIHQLRDGMATATATDIRGASLAKLSFVDEASSSIETAVAAWIRRSLPQVEVGDALWIIEHQALEHHQAWWLRAVREGLRNGLEQMSPEWAQAVWRWWGEKPEAIGWMASFLGNDIGVENALLAQVPDRLPPTIHGRVRELCRKREWVRLLAGMLRVSEPLLKAVGMLREMVSEPQRGLEVLVGRSRPEEIVVAAASCEWQPLIQLAVRLTTKNVKLLEEVDLHSRSTLVLLGAHLAAGGAPPSAASHNGFFHRVFEGCIEGDEACREVLSHLSASGAAAALGYSRQDALWGAVQVAQRDLLLSAAATEWLRRFAAGLDLPRPGPVLASAVRSEARGALKGGPISRVLDFLAMFPEVSENDVSDWLIAEGFSWRHGDDERLGHLLLARDWKAAARRFRWSWKTELKSAAWHAQALLSFWDRWLASQPNIYFAPFGSRMDERKIPISEPQVRQVREAPSFKFDVGIITMKEEEYSALLEKLGPSESHTGANRDYDVAVIGTPRGKCRVAITRCIQQGNAHAQNAATEMLSDLSPSFVLVVGIAGGVPTPDFCLGDVVISDYIQDLTLEDTGTTSESRRYNALGGPLHPSASRIVERLRSVERAASWNDADTIGQERPGLEGKYTTGDHSWNADIAEALERHAGKSSPTATARKIASSDRLIKDPELLQVWRAVLKGIAAVEMESAGAYIPCQRNNVPVLAIRGISDIVGWKRDEAWTLYACHTAAAYTRMLIGAGVFCAGD